MTQQNSRDKIDSIVQENIRITAHKHKSTNCLCNAFLPDLSTLVTFYQLWSNSVKQIMVVSLFLFLHKPQLVKIIQQFLSHGCKNIR